MQDKRTPIEQIRDLTRTLIDAALKDGPTIQLNVRAEDETLEIAGGQLELYRESPDDPGFYLVKAVIQHNYPHAPDSVDMADVGYYLSPSEAAAGIVLTLAEASISNRLDQLADDALAMEMAKEGGPA